MIGDNYFLLNSVDSTNNYAMGKVHAGLAKHGYIYQAREQTAGKGQRGKTWQTERDQNITLSVVLDTRLLLFSSQFLLSAAVSLAVVDVCKQNVNSDFLIKWPNDIYWRDRKAGGILIENVIHGVEWKYAIAGIGLNVNQVTFPPGVPNPVSLKQISGKDFNIVLLAKELCACLDRRWKQLVDGHSPELIQTYNDYLYKRGEQVKLKKNNINFQALIREVNREGELVTEAQGIQQFKTGEIQWVL